MADWWGLPASNMAKEVDALDSYLHVLRVIMLAFLNALAPTFAIEMGRRAIPRARASNLRCH